MADFYSPNAPYLFDRMDNSNKKKIQINESDFIKNVQSFEKPFDLIVNSIEFALQTICKISRNNNYIEFIIHNPIPLREPNFASNAWKKVISKYPEIKVIGRIGIFVNCIFICLNIYSNKKSLMAGDILTITEVSFNTIITFLFMFKIFGIVSNIIFILETWGLEKIEAADYWADEYIETFGNPILSEPTIRIERDY